MLQADRWLDHIAQFVAKSAMTAFQCSLCTVADGQRHQMAAQKLDHQRLTYAAAAAATAAAFDMHQVLTL